MKKYYLSFLLISILFSCIENQKLETISLFNGENLDGWIIYGTEKWYVEDYELVCESGPDKEYGYLGTEENFDDFILTLQFKQENNGNSGVFFRSSVDGTKVKGWQVEVAPPGLHSGGIYESYGRGWLIKPDSAKDSVVKMGEWNSMKIKVISDEVTTSINGTEMIKIKDSIIGKGIGGVALQIHDGGGIKVRWKNLKIQKL
jgi:hypothetical protein|tara:strand:- start:441 stop:1046 length:606 start_codon:yes stop_codon:yes gene_type:complete